jgi:C1A family cysteine protease
MYKLLAIIIVEPNAVVDWRKQPGVASTVKNQGVCGAGWAFGAIGAVEGFYATKKGQRYLNLAE